MKFAVLISQIIFLFGSKKNEEHGLKRVGMESTGVPQVNRQSNIRGRKRGMRG